MYNRDMKEIWKPINEKYLVSSWGRIKGPRKTTYGSVGSRGYMQICISRSTLNIHVLVAEAFLGPRPRGYHICHKDGDKTNNKIENLRYDTPKGNWQDFRLSKKKTSHAISREVCPLGHQLAGSNLMSSQLKRGWRSCLACSRAHAYMRNGKHREIMNHKELADNYYERLKDDNS
jgi:hypothetical protein